MRKKARINVKGKIRKTFYDLLSKIHSRRHGVETDITHHSGEHVEVIIEGHESDVWKMVRWNKSGPLFCSVDEVLLQFSDIEVEMGAKTS